MKIEEKERKAREIAEFRYALIAELANKYLSHGQLKELINEKAKRQYDIPYSTKTTITAACIKKWLSQYRKYGKEGLKPKRRSDYGKSRVLSLEETDELRKYLETHPGVTATAALKKLKEEGKIKSDISSSSLSRIIISSGLDRKNRIRAVSNEKNLKFEFFSPLECVQADDMHAFKVPVTDVNGKKRKAILIAFIDDATRRIVYANFSFTERSYEFEKGIKHILKSHGRIGRLYTDNGATFVSGQTQRILDILGITIIHSRPFKPAGRGKIERFFRTVRDQFLRPLDKESIKGLGDLNAKFRTWLESEYHRNPHRGLSGKTPLEAWLAKAKYIIPMDLSIDLDRIFLHEISRRVYKDSTVTLNGTLYEVPSILAGKRIKLYFDPLKPVKRPLILCDGKDYGNARVVDSYANSKVKRGEIGKEITLVYDDKEVKDALPPTIAALSASKVELEGGEI
ncbi:MAG: DDE-type integrase/transposase/recombinase [Spirochaetales bacterium]|nr:DDE-type integrase/transposase/recombinase [Spirochaetales bacterium]